MIGISYVFLFALVVKLFINCVENEVILNPNPES